MTIMTKRRAGVTAAAALAAAALAGAPAQAATVAPGGGATTLTLSKGATKALTSLGVSVRTTGAAKALKGGGQARFPITGGKYDPATGAGTYRHSGGLRLKAGGTSLKLSSFRVDAVKGRLSVQVSGGKRLHAFTLSLAKAKLKRPGLGTTVSGVRVALSAKGAKALNTVFGVTAFKRGLVIGTATVKATPKQVAFAGGATSLTLDPGAVAALTSLGVTPGLAAPATANPDGSFAFPITGGKVDGSSLAGAISHSGGITLTKGTTVVTLKDFVIDSKRSVLTADVGGARADILALDLSKAAVAIDGRAVNVTGVPATLTQAAADALNGAFATTAFTAGLAIGTANVAGQAV
jgi:Htaa